MNHDPDSNSNLRNVVLPECIHQVQTVCTSMLTTQATLGFLYLEYGPTAWWWEVEELVRKLLLSSLVVLIDAGSPLQVMSVLSCRIVQMFH